MNWFILALLSAIFAALTAIFSKIGLDRVDTNFATIIRSAVMALFLIVVGLASGKLAPEFWHSLDKKAVLFIVLSAVAVALSWICYFLALKMGLASKVTPVNMLSIVFVFIFASIFLGEKISTLSILGIFLMVLGAILLAF